MIECKLKAKNCNRGQLFRPGLFSSVKSARRSAENTLPSHVRPVPNVVLLPCRTQMKLSFRFKHGSSTPFETIKRGTAELGSARLLSTASLAVSHGSSTTCFQTACYCRAELNS